jgi:hypothetical protein
METEGDTNGKPDKAVFYSVIGFHVRGRGDGIELFELTAKSQIVSKISAAEMMCWHAYIL